MTPRASLMLVLATVAACSSGSVTAPPPSDAAPLPPVAPPAPPPAPSLCTGRQVPVQFISTSQGDLYTTRGDTLARPGDTLVVQAGSYREIAIDGLQGTAECPIVIQNRGGVARLSRGINLGWPTRHVVVSGGGAAGVRYGLVLGPGVPNVADRFGLQMRGAGPFTIENVEVTHAMQGMQIKIDAVCDRPHTRRENTTIRDIVVRDNWVHHSRFEALYLGRSAPLRPQATCNGTLQELQSPVIDGLTVTDKRIESNGNDGIQVSNALNVLIARNLVLRSGTAGSDAHNHGIVLGGNSSGTIRDNAVGESGGASVAIFGAGDAIVRCNSLRMAGNEMILASARPGDNLSNQLPLRVLATDNLLDAPQSRPIAVYGRPELRPGEIRRNRILNRPASQAGIAAVVDQSGGVVEENGEGVSPGCVVPVLPGR